MLTNGEGQVCNCQRIDCWHKPHECDEPPQHMYGQCLTCKTYNPRRCVTCGQVVPEEGTDRQ